jgi:prepilin-type N-terminal cleavage/methylation domain-containing protein
MVLKYHGLGTHTDVTGYTERGFTLIESTVAIAIVSVAIALPFAMSGFARFATHQAGPVRTAAMVLAEQTLRIAEDAWKYGSPGESPAGSMQTTVPLLIPNAAPTTAPVTLRTSVTETGSSSAQIAVTVLYTPDAGHMQDNGSVTLTGEIQVKSPLPASTIAPAGLIAQPSDAP